jgi:citronellol/citronellal dehydrogenase
MSLKGKTIFITGGSRGIGESIALKCAEDGANIAIAAKTAKPHPKLPGTIFTVAEEIDKRGGKGFPLQVDVRDEDQVAEAISKTADTFGGIDIVINNASAIFIAGTEAVPMKRYDLMQDCNARGTFVTSKAAIPYLKKSGNPHILNMSPPLNMDKKWFAGHLAYTMAKYGMSMCTLGMAEEFKSDGIAVNSLWPRTTIATSAIEVFFPQILPNSRKPEIVADAVYAILNKDSREVTGNFFIDDEVLAAEGIQDLSAYAVNPDAELQPDFFL